MSESVKAVVFDAYGTLFDVHSVTALADEIFSGQGTALSAQWRAKQLEYTWLQTLMGRYEDFEAVTRAALDYACKALQLDCDSITCERLMREYLRLKPFPEVGEALRALFRYRLAILSNGSPNMLNPLITNAGMQETFEHVISVDELKIYKPDPRVYKLACDKLSVDKTDIAFISSNFWDVSGSGHFGFRAFWINRVRAHPDPLGYAPVATLGGLTELAQQLTGR
ncbi:MAG TPA: haloacid dehalogenase type II [Burkholderiales bacterium]|nr:haloacid dehalogenase type II [Burkholderiales bacterium]